MEVSGVWVGDIRGTNVGEIVVHLVQKGGDVTVREVYRSERRRLPLPRGRPGSERGRGVSKSLSASSGYIFR